MSSIVQAPMIQAPAVPVAVVTPGRDLRLDLFRGLALWLIFLDHVPNNIVVAVAGNISSSSFLELPGSNRKERR